MSTGGRPLNRARTASITIATTETVRSYSPYKAWGLVVLALVLVVGLGRLAVTSIVLASIAQRPMCNELPRVINARAVHLTPGVIEHQSWIDFPVPARFSGYFAFCMDGHRLQFGGGDLTYPDGIARFNVSTTWVDLVWFAGDISAYTDLSRWELRLLCSPLTPC